MTKFRELRVGDRFRFVGTTRRPAAMVGRFEKVSDKRFSPALTHTLDRALADVCGTLYFAARGGESVERLPPPPTAEDIADVAGAIVRRDAGPDQ